MWPVVTHLDSTALLLPSCGTLSKSFFFHPELPHPFMTLVPHNFAGWTKGEKSHLNA